MKILKYGKDKTFENTCMHCLSDIEYGSRDVQFDVEYKKDKSSTVFQYAIECPCCEKITRVNLYVRREVLSQNTISRL